MRAPNPISCAARRDGRESIPVFRVWTRQRGVVRVRRRQTLPSAAGQVAWCVEGGSEWGSGSTGAGTGLVYPKGQGWDWWIAYRWEVVVVLGGQSPGETDHVVVGSRVLPESLLGKKWMAGSLGCKPDSPWA